MKWITVLLMAIVATCGRCFGRSFLTNNEHDDYVVQESIANRRPWSLDDVRRVWSLLNLRDDQEISDPDQNRRQRRTINGQNYKKFSAAGIVGGGSGSSSYTSINCFLTPIQCRRYGRSGVAIVRRAH